MKTYTVVLKFPKSKIVLPQLQYYSLNSRTLFYATEVIWHLCQLFGHIELACTICRLINDNRIAAAVNMIKSKCYLLDDTVKFHRLHDCKDIDLLKASFDIRHRDFLLVQCVIFINVGTKSPVKSC